MKIDSIFKKRRVVLEKLAEFGFTMNKAGLWDYQLPVAGGLFMLNLTVNDAGGVETALYDTANREEYVLVHSSSRMPWRVLRRKDCVEFVREHAYDDERVLIAKMLKSDVEEVLYELAEKCFIPDVFMSALTQQVIAHVRDVYGDELEFLWRQYPDCSIWRRQDTQKWYAALMELPKSKLGVDSEELVDVLDLRLPPGEMAGLIDRVRYFPGYHMNKKHWYTVCLDGSIPLEEIGERIAVSYSLANK